MSSRTREIWRAFKLDSQVHYLAGLYYAGFKNQTVEQKFLSAHHRALGFNSHRNAEIAGAYYLKISDPPANDELY